MNLVHNLVDFLSSAGQVLNVIYRLISNTQTDRYAVD
jgi:hypothetical protein